MTNLTAAEQKILNNISREKDPSIFLGDKLHEIIAFQASEGTPTNALEAQISLAVTGVVVAGETVSIDNPLQPGVDVYEFIAGPLSTKSAPTNIPVDISANATASSGTLTMDTQPTAGDKVTIGEKVYTFVPVGTDTADGEVSIGADLAGAQAALVAAINGTDGISDPHPLVTAGAFTANASTITAIIGGVSGDSIATTETFTAVTNVFGAATLGSGADCIAADAITALVAAIADVDTQGVAADDGTGDTVDIYAVTAGAAGNNIAVVETMANGAFAGGATKLAGGADGTVAEAFKMMVDNSYLYVAIAANTIGGKNWRRISIGSAF